MTTIAFEEHRSHLRGVAYRMLGSISEADDAVQETWLRLDRADPSEVANPRGWLWSHHGLICTGETYKSVVKGAKRNAKAKKPTAKKKPASRKKPAKK